MSDAELLRLAEVAGAIGGLLGICAFLPQAYRIVQRRSAADISLTMYLLAIASCLLWLFYAWVHGAVALFLTNVVLLVISCVILGLKLHFDREK